MLADAPEVIARQITCQEIAVNPNESTAHLALAIRDVLDQTDWQYSEIWLPINPQPNQPQGPSLIPMDNANVLLELSQIWAMDSRQSFLELHAWENFWSCSRGFLVDAGEGLPGRAWSTGHWEWISDASTHSEHHFLRNQIARAFQVKAGLAVPLISVSQNDPATKSTPEGVALFFMSEGRGQDRWLIQKTCEILASHQTLSLEALQPAPYALS